MRNPLRKRHLRELKSDFGKYAAIALFMIMLVGLVSGYLVAAGSVERTFYEGWDKYIIEDGHITFSKEPDSSVLQEIEEKAGLTFYNLDYIEEDTDSNGTTLRIYRNRTDVNLACVMDGSLPETASEIAVDRIFAENNGLSIGDTVTLNGKSIKITGIVALVDFNCLFENNNDMMFNGTIFGVAVMTPEGFEALHSTHMYHNYAWRYDETPEDENEENAKSEELMEILEEVITEYDEKAAEEEIKRIQENAFATGVIEDFDESVLLKVDNYIAKYQNKSITYCMDDMEGDKPMFILFDYIVTVILAFVFAVTISSTIQKEAGVIGTLRASGYKRSELVRHYLFMPTVVTVISAVIGNILGYTVFVNMMKDVFYTSFSLATYESVFSAEAFTYTTVIPLALMVVINLYMLVRVLKLSPIRFLRRDLARKHRRRAVLLNKKWNFFVRFRLRILFQNISVYIVLCLGIMFGGIIAVFGFMFGPLLRDYADMIVEEKICNYQYVLITPEDTDTADAEKYCLGSLKSAFPGYVEDEISIYGIEENSEYITKTIPEGQVLVSEGILEKFRLKTGDTITLKESYGDDTYDFVIAGTYSYSAALAVFMNRDDYLEKFDKDENYFTGYFSNTGIEDIDSDLFATVITESDLTKVSDQMENSLGDFMELFKYFGAIMLMLLMYLMTKQVIEKSAQSIAMTKILGFRDGEIARLYLVITGIVVVMSLLITMPVTDAVLRWAFNSCIYSELSGYIPYIVSDSCYILTFIIGIVCFLIVTLFMMRKIGKIEKSEALKNVE